MNCWPPSDDKSDGRFDLDGRRVGSASTVVREGTTLAVGRDVAVAPDVAAEVLRDTRRWPDWGPAIDGVESDDRYVSRGTTGRVSVGGAWLPFRVTAYNGRRWDWRVAGLPATGHRVDRYAGESDRSRVVIEVPIVAAWYVPVCRRALDRFAALVESDGES
ncbi:MAG: SRPBCC family protein [Halorubrum sp.]